MHYDAVKSDGQACEDVTPSPPAYAVRAWLPLHVVDAAPLLLSNSTWLYDNACPRRALSPVISPVISLDLARDLDRDLA